MKVILTQFRENMTPMLTQIRRWLMQPKVCRFVGFASAVVGLLCYALSSSFNHLFGDWDLLKIFLYSIFSSIICLMILYAKIWQHSRSLRFKAHAAFLVLTITSVYSFFSDKVMYGKPDAYSLISCAAFAIMSLSLSRQSQCRFEMDLLYFFLGCLILQLMKIKLQLAVVGAGFSYCLVILSSSFSSIYAAADNEYYRLLDENSIVIDVDSPQLSSTDIASMMEQLGTCVKALQQENSNLTDVLLEQVNQYLEDDSELLIIDQNFMIDALPQERINDLQESVKLMVGAGFEKECSEVYSSWRRGFLQEILINKLFRLQSANIKNEHERVEYIDTVIRRWITASDVALKVLFPMERGLCDGVFSGFSSAAARCFTEVCEGATLQLLNFANAAADGRPSTWRLFKMLAILETLRYLIPKFQTLFPDSFVKEAIEVQNRLGEACRDLFTELNNDLIFRVPLARQVAPADGQHHPLTVHVMSYLASACRSWRRLEQILQEYPKVANRVGVSSFIAQMERVMVMLEKYLISKSKNLRDPALRSLFMMNNRRLIEAINKSWELGTIFCDDWFRKNQAKIQQDLELYQSSSWNEVLDLLKLNNNESMAPNDNVTAELLKGKLSSFNKNFEEISRVQSTWSVYDEKLREEIIISVGNVLLPAYGIFIGSFRDVIGNHTYKYIEYGMFEIEDRLNHLFLGNKY